MWANYARPRTQLRNGTRAQCQETGESNETRWIEMRTKLLEALEQFPGASEAVRVALSRDNEDG
jgi:hypothetical protein